MDKDIDETKTSDESEEIKETVEKTDNDEDDTLRLYFEKMKINPVFKQQQEAARNLNALRLKVYDENYNKFKENTDNIVKSVGIKAIKDTNPDLAEAIEEAQIIDKRLNPNRAREVSEASEKVKDIVTTIHNWPNSSGWNKKAETMADELKLLNLDYPTEGKGGSKFYKDIDIDKEFSKLGSKTSAIEAVHNRLKQRRTELQEQIDSYKPDTFKTSKQVAIDKYDEFFAHAEPTLTAFKELITNYSKFLTPEVITELEGEVEQIKDYINDARDKGVKAGEIKKYYELVNKVRENVRNNYQDILNKLNAYSNSVSAEDALISEIKSLASYEQYSQLPPDIFEKLPDDIKNKVIRLMELKAKLQKQQGKTKSITQKYKLNVDNKPISEDKDSRKVINPALFRGYKLFENVKLHQTFY